MKRCFIALFCLLNINSNAMQPHATGNNDPLDAWFEQQNQPVAESVQMQSSVSDVEPGVKAILMDSLSPKLKILFEEFKKRKNLDSSVRFKGCRPVCWASRYRQNEFSTGFDGRVGGAVYIG